MAKDVHQERILIVGDDTSVTKVGFGSLAGADVEIVGSLAEAEEKQASNCYSKIIIDPEVLGTRGIEVLGQAAPEQIFQTLHEVVFHLDVNWRFTYLNHEAEVYFHKSAHELLGTDFKELVAETTPSEFLEECEKVMVEGGESGILEIYSPLHQAWFDASVYHTQAGVVIHLHDSTARKKVEQALVQAQEDAEQRAVELAVLMDAVPAVVFISHDTEGRYITGNRATYEFLRLPESANVSETASESERPRNFIAMSNSIEIAPSDLPVQRAAKGEEIWDCELDIVFDDGETRTIYGNAMPLYDDGKPSGSVGAFVDITERKRAEEALREGREDLNRAQAVARTGSWRLNVHRNELLWSDETYRMFGIPNGTPLTYDIFLSTVHPEDREYVDMEWTAALSGAQYDIEHRIVVNGEVKWVRERAELEFDEEGQLLGGFGTVQDITRQKQMEQQQRELLEREHHIAQILQQAILPSEVLERIGNYRVIAKYQPAMKEAEIGGDFYDIFQIDESRYGILIGDVAGKGLDAAIRVAAARYTIRSYALLDPRPGRVISLANDALCKAETDIGNLMTAFFGVLDIGSGVISYASAGHEPPIVSGKDCEIQELHVSGIPLGVMLNAKYSEASMRLSSGQRIVMVTDGIIEARDADNNLYAQQGLIDCVRRHCGSDAREFATHLMEEANAFAGGHTQDDAAIVVIDVE